ncbi:MAG: HD domain-containing phosphohydrolase [Anaerolineales bacterium]
MNEKPCILIVDDEPIIWQTLEALLPAETYELQYARDGAEGLSKAIALQPDAILLDVMLPRMDGFAVCRQLREHPLLAEVPILMITSLDDRPTRLAGLEAGADDFLTKPFDTLELLARLKTITRLNRYRHLIEQRDRLARMNEELRAAYQQTIEGWSQALDLRDHETTGHTRRVTDMTIRLARLVGVEEEAIEHIRRGAILHDIGKMGIPDSILHKAGPLTEEEWKIMRQHPIYAYEWLSVIDFLRPALDIPYCHHEHWDGSGYPRGLRGEQIPLAARLFTIVDVWDALRSDRPYRHALPEQDAIAYVQAQKGLLFDPQLTAVFLKHIRQIV